MTNIQHQMPNTYYQSMDVTGIARDLLGKLLISEIDGRRTVVRIAETEAYRAPEDRASHAYGNRLTPRTRVMFEPGGRAYIYLCYGIHHLFNVVTGPEGVAHAVLIRGGIPVEGIDTMLERRNKRALDATLTAGPGTLSQAMGFQTRYTDMRFDQPDRLFWIADDGFAFAESEIKTGPRIGVDYAGECADWPWRFYV
jgi:DNA-3-methyladenine glycosylase